MSDKPSNKDHFKATFIADEICSIFQVESRTPIWHKIRDLLIKRYASVKLKENGNNGDNNYDDGEY